MIRFEWFGSYNERPERREFLKVVQSWDTGMTANPGSDYSVRTTWGFRRGDRKWYLLDVLRRRMEYPDLCRAVLELHRRFSADRVLIEKTASGHALIQELRATGPAAADRGQGGHKQGRTVQRLPSGGAGRALDPAARGALAGRLSRRTAGIPASQARRPGRQLQRVRQTQADPLAMAAHRIRTGRTGMRPRPDRVVALSPASAAPHSA